MKINIQKLKLKEKIYRIRNHNVMLDRDLAMLYGVETKRINEAIKRNLERFPEDFAFRLTKQEVVVLRSQFATANIDSKSRVHPHVFTEHGILMLSSVLKSPKAIQTNIQIMRTFVHLREITQENKEIWDKIQTLENKYDERFKIIFDALKQLMREEQKEKKKIGFHARSGQKI